MPRTSKRLGKFFDELPRPIDHVLVTGPGPYYARLAEFDFERARRDLEAHILLPLQVARNAASKVRQGGTLLFMGGTGGRRTAPGFALISALTAASPAMTKLYQPVLNRIGGSAGCSWLIASAGFFWFNASCALMAGSQSDCTCVSSGYRLFRSCASSAH
jgi:hypothetical protein